jgi:hypothetical protein
MRRLIAIRDPNEIDSHEPCHGFDLVNQLRTQIHTPKTARSLFEEALDINLEKNIYKRKS